MMGKVAAIAGTISSTTFAMIHMLNQKGYRVILSTKEKEICLENIRDCGAMLEYVKCDTSSMDRQAWTAYIKEHFGQLDLFIYSVKIPVELPVELMEVTCDVLQSEVFDQLNECFFMCQSAGRLLLDIQKKGRAEGISRMVIISAIPPDAHNNQIYQLYVKGIASIAAMFANELSANLIPVFGISGGVGMDNIPARKISEYIQLIANGAIPNNRFCQPDDMVKCLCAVESGLLDSSAGQQLYADGGYHIRWNKF